MCNFISVMIFLEDITFGEAAHDVTNLNVGPLVSAIYRPNGGAC